MLFELRVLGLTFSGYYIMMAVGFLLMIALMLIKRKCYGLTVLKALLFTLCVMVAGVSGCRILYILENISQIIQYGIFERGFSFFGAVFLVPLIIIPVGKLFGLTIGKSTDAAAICVCAMVGTIRIGCFFSGCCGGKTMASGFQWPTQIMESIGDYLILSWLLYCGKQEKPGLYLRFMICYGCLRFIIEFFRSSSEGTILDIAHFLALLSIGIGASVLLTINEQKGLHKEVEKRK